jgi:16S rRNA (cytosine967-C5)-methyltransferase
LQTSFQTSLKGDSLAYSLLGAAQAVALVRTGTNLPQALAQLWARSETSPQARGAMQDIAYRCMRQLGQSEALIAQWRQSARSAGGGPAGLRAGPDDGARRSTVRRIHRGRPDRDGGRSPPGHGARQGHGQRRAAPLPARAQGLAGTALLQPVAQWNYPQWWIDAARTAWPRDWQAMLGPAMARHR